MGSEKVAYVKAQSQTRDHHCHWPGCKRQVPPAMWGCKSHWMLLPRRLRARIWATYEPGQEIDGTPSHAYIEAARAVQDWIRSQVPDLAEALIQSLAEAKQDRKRREGHTDDD